MLMSLARAIDHSSMHIVGHLDLFSRPGVERRKGTGGEPVKREKYTRVEFALMRCN